MRASIFLRERNATTTMGSGERTYDNGCRGVGGTRSVPCTSVGEENLLRVDDMYYPEESILVHELAHTIMNIGVSEQVC